jgi:hypothetical protein
MYKGLLLIGAEAEGRTRYRLRIFRAGGVALAQAGHALVDIGANHTPHMLMAGINKLLDREPTAGLSIEVEHELGRNGLYFDPAARRVRRRSRAAPPA